MNRYVALLRGINVGTASRIAMADLRALVEDLGATRVRTLLQSGNVIFDREEPLTAAELEHAITERTGVSSRVVILPANRFVAVARANPLADAADPSRMLITFVDGSPEPAGLERPTDAELAPERIVIGADAVYLWFPDGVMKSKLPARYLERLAPVATSRNLRTVTKILAMLAEG